MRIGAGNAKHEDLVEIGAKQFLRECRTVEIEARRG